MDNTQLSLVNRCGSHQSESQPTCNEDPVALPMVSFTESIIDLSSANPRTSGTDSRLRVINAVRIMATIREVESDPLLAGVGTIPWCVNAESAEQELCGSSAARVREHDLAVLHSSRRKVMSGRLEGVL